jgi:hypothetical protein
MGKEIVKWIGVALVGVVVGMYGRSVYADLAFLHAARLTYDAQRAQQSVKPRVGETK